MMGEEVEGFEARSMITIRAGNVDGRAGRFKRGPPGWRVRSRARLPTDMDRVGGNGGYPPPSSHPRPETKFGRNLDRACTQPEGDVGACMWRLGGVGGRHRAPRLAHVSEIPAIQFVNNK
jgi:hypothetical protein